MECRNCELRQRQFFCENCLRTQSVWPTSRLYYTTNNTAFCSLRDKRLQTQHFATDRDEQVAKASKLLGPVSDARLRWAEVASCEDRVEHVMNSLVSLRKDNDNSALFFVVINF
jgi:hypothetical protein